MNHYSNPAELAHKPMNTEGDDLVLQQPLRRKAGSGTRVVTQPTEQQSSGKALIPPMSNKIGAGSFLAAKHSMHQGIHHLKRKSNKALGDITGIILNNMKGEANNSGSSAIRQIKHLGSNPGSRVGSTKAGTRIGDQTTIIKKGVNAAHANPEKFAGSIFRPAPKIGGVGIPTVHKDGGASGRRPAMNHAGSGTRVQHPTTNF